MRSYDQYCGLARGLDLVGDRWSLLVVRELALGDRRYGELADGLPGIASNLLADRLRQLTAADVVERRPADGRPGYGLTDRGRALLPTLHSLVRWSTPAMLDGPDPVDHEQPRWVAFAAAAYLRTAPPAMQLRVLIASGDDRIVVHAADGAVTTVLADHDDPDLRVTAGTWALMGLVSGSVELARIRRLDPDAVVNGSRSARRALRDLVRHNTHAHHRDLWTEPVGHR